MASLIVAGSTGAIGREVVRLAVADPFFASVTALTRRPLLPGGAATVDAQSEAAVAALAAAFPLTDPVAAAGKLRVVPVDWEALVATHGLVDEAVTKKNDIPTTTDTSANQQQKAAAVRAAFAGHSHAAMCLGTTRADAGSAEAFRRVDLLYVVAFMEELAAAAAAAPGPAPAVRVFSQVSSQGASATSWLLYPQTKGRADEAAFARSRVGTQPPVEYQKSNKLTRGVFGRVAVWRPGLLQRKDRARGLERFASCIISAMPVERVAAAMLADMKREEAAKAAAPATATAPVPTHGAVEPRGQRGEVFDNAAINKLTPVFVADPRP